MGYIILIILVQFLVWLRKFIKLLRHIYRKSLGRPDPPNEDDTEEIEHPPGPPLPPNGRGDGGNGGNCAGR